MTLKRFFNFSLLLLLLSTGHLLRAQAPAASSAVMLQGFFWNSTTTTSWTQLNSMVGDISKNFDMVWLPPSAYAGTNVSGYLPKQWSNQNSNWGTVSELKTLISNLKSNGTIAIADIVINHRDGNKNWVDFYADNFGAYGSYQLNISDICSTDESRLNGYTPTGNPDTGENYEAARDLDHTSANVQNDVKAYLQWMKNEIGYGGWRYDLVKGFAPSFINIYNNAAGGSFSVGEYWDGDYDKVWNWVKGTNYNSTAFDFPGKYAALNNGLASANYNAMAWLDGSVKRPAGLVHSPASRRYAVTFVDNHDTYDTPGSIYNGNIPQAYAFILSSPGIPCVFYPHWNTYKTEINKMIAARKAVGLTSESNVVVTNTTGYYEAKSTGTKGEMITRIGSWSGAPSDYTLQCNGDGWAMYTKITTPIDVTPIGSITIRAKVPTSWTSPKIWIWDFNGTANYTGGVWPGAAMLGTDAEGYYSISLTGVSASKLGVVINNGAASGTQQTVDLATSANICWDLSLTPNSEGKYTATVNSTCSSGTSSVADKTTTRVRIYPNPIENVMNVSAEKSITSVIVSSLSGKEIIRTSETTVPTVSLPKGVYLVKITSDDGYSEVKKVVKK